MRDIEAGSPSSDERLDGSLCFGGYERHQRLPELEARVTTIALNPD